MTKNEAKDILEKFSANEYIQGGKFKVDAQALIVTLVTITFEL